MDTYRIQIKDGFGRKMESFDLQAANLRLAMDRATKKLALLDAGHGSDAVSVTVELIPMLDATLDHARTFGYVPMS